MDGLQPHNTQDVRPVQANRPDVIDEAFDGEVTLIHLGTGLFYGLDAAAGAVWLQLRDGGDPSQAAMVLAEAHGLEAADVHDDVEAFVARLREEGLVVPAERVGEAVAVTVAAPWASPQLDRFEDMADLLLLDPVHDIQLDENGWPIPRDPSAGAQAA